MVRTTSARIAVLGAGPIGLEAALYARRLDLPVTVYEAGRVGEYLHRWGHVRLFSPFGMNSTSLGRAAIREQNSQHSFPADSDCTTGKQHLAVYLEPLAKCATLKGCIQTETQVLSVGRRGFFKDDTADLDRRAQQPFRLLLREAKGRERVDEADVVLDCTGTYGQHRWLGDGGIPAIGELTAEPNISYGLDDVLGEKLQRYAGKSVLLVGSGYSAATTACNLAELGLKHPETWVIWLARGSSSQPIPRFASDPLRERDRLAVRANMLATRGDGNIEFHNQSVIESVEYQGPDRGFRVTARCARKSRTWEIERVIGNVGYTPDTNLIRELRVRASSAPSEGINAPPPLEPNFFILGAKSYGRDSRFLLRDGFEQVREVFALITGKADLDLYRKR